MTGFVVEAFAAMAKNSLRGFATIRMPSGMVIHDVGVHEKSGSVWASPPAKPAIGRDGTQMVDANGRKKWTPIISFGSRQSRDRWSAAVVEAVRTSHPEAFDDRQ